MFESLRRAEAERRERMLREGAARKSPRVEQVGAAPAPPPKPPTPLTPPRPAAPAAPAVQPWQAEPIAEIAPEASEDLREMGILRNSIDTLLERKAKRSIIFTSATDGEGTTTLAASYAALLAMKEDTRVLLVEMNARAPALVGRFGLEGPYGMTHYLTGHAGFASLVHRVPQAGYDVIHVGEDDPTRIQLLLEGAFPRFLEEAHQHYDTLIIDAPPVFSAPETPPMTPMVDGVVMVLKCDKTKREIVQRSLNMIKQFEGNVLGVVLNRKKYYIPAFIYKRI